MTLYQEKGPPELLDLLANHYAEHASNPSESPHAEQLAYRAARHAGWYRTPGGWRRLGPDVRDKVNVRQAVRQPDGTFAVQDVDVFYPNAVKGAGSQYPAERVYDAIRNTNASISHGAQPPGLTKEHPLIERKALGIATPVFGAGINWRESPRGRGWARCDLVGVDPSVYAEWRAGRWTGLSAGFAQDAEGLNFRFGHIALLGADLQALSRLPRTEVYSDEGQLCFAADAGLMSPIYKGRTMTKEQFAALKSSHAQLAAAFAAGEAGEPGADEKIKAAKLAHEKARKEAGDDPKDGSEKDAQNASATNDQGRTGTVIPDDTDLDASLTDEPADGGAGTEVPGGMCSATTIEEFASQLDAVRSELNIQRRVNAALLGRHLATEFSSFCSDLAGKGHQFDAGAAMDMFKSVAADPKAVEKLKKMLQASPKSALTAGNGQPTFAAGVGDAPAHAAPAAAQTNTADTDAKVLDLLRKQFPGQNFSADDIALGSTPSAITQVM